MQNIMVDMPFWTKSACEWDPNECESANFHIAFRSVGRPLSCWHDFISDALPN